MNSISVPISTPSVIRMQRYPRAVVIVTVALLFLGGGLMMHAESQIQVLALLAAFLAVFALAERAPRCAYTGQRADLGQS